MLEKLKRVIPGEIIEMDGEKGKRISAEQRELMLDFMTNHPALATGKFTSPDGAKHKQRLLSELARALNCCPNGVTKSEDKWMKSWQDWRSDVKSKAAHLKREMNKTGGGKISTSAKPLTALEEKLLGFLGPNVVSGHIEILDPLEELQSVVTNITGGRNEASGSGDYQECIIMPLDELTHNVTVAPLTHNVAVAQPQAPSSPFSVPSPLNSDGSNSTSSSQSSEARKRPRRNTSCSVPEEGNGEKLVRLSEMTLEIEKSKLELMKQQAALQVRQTEAVESAAQAFCGAMRAFENFMKMKTDLI